MGLTCLQILFLREHNRLCDDILKADPSLSDEEVFNTARNFVIGLIQKISFSEYLPNLFGKIIFRSVIGDYRGYNIESDPTIINEFASTAYRIGHPYIPRIYKTIDGDNKTI